MVSLEDPQVDQRRSGPDWTWRGGPRSLAWRMESRLLDNPSIPQTVTTRVTFAGTPESLWERMMFYEDVTKPPPWILRTLLPVPVRSEGEKSRVGEAVLCRYRSGHLVKRVTGIDRTRRYEFVIAEQDLRMRGIILLGGSYAFRKLPHDRTEVSLETVYRSRNRPRWLWSRLEVALCHVFHHNILNGMRGPTGSP